MELMGGDPAYRNAVFRLHPGNERTTKLLLGIRDGCRFSWNRIKGAFEFRYANACGRPIDSPSFFTLGKAFGQLLDDVPWLQDLPCKVVRYALKYQAEAWQGYLDGERGCPKWKNRFADLAFTIPDNVRIRDDRPAVPKVGWLRISRRGEKPYADERPVKSVVKRVGRCRYAIVTYKPQGWIVPNQDGFTELDCIVWQVADGEGEIHPMPDLAHLEAKERRHRRALLGELASLSHEEKDSKWRANARRKVTRATRRVRNADINAVRNILALGAGTPARGGAFTSAAPGTRETDTRPATG